MIVTGTWMNRFGIIVCILLGAFSLVSCRRVSQPEGSTVILIVRHAEKASEAEDSPLTEAGTERAKALVKVAENAGVSAIYTTQLKRNRDTARPFAERARLPLAEMPVNLASPGDYGQRLARDIMEKHRGQTVLVIGHGNTIGSLVEGLSGKAAPFESVEYPDLFIVTIAPSGSTGIIKSQYGR